MLYRLSVLYGASELLKAPLSSNTHKDYSFAVSLKRDAAAAGHPITKTNETVTWYRSVTAWFCGGAEPVTRDCRPPLRIKCRASCCIRCRNYTVALVFVHIASFERNPFVLPSRR